MPDDIALSVKNLHKDFLLPHERTNSIKEVVLHFNKPTYEKMHALQDINFEVKRGEFFGIVGRNGSGKSTLLKLIGGIYQPTKGSIQVNGTLTPFIELGIGFNPELTGRENVFMNGAILGLTRKEIQKKYKEIVDFAELHRFMDQKLKNYSSGMQVRLAFSIAIQAHNDILLLDEVLAVGDANFQQKCYTYFEELKRQNKTVIFVSHDMGAVKRFCTQAVYISGGKLISKGSPSDIADIYVSENLQTSDDAGHDLSALHGIKTRTTQRDGELVLSVSYDSKDDEQLYIGLSVIKDGISFAEIITDLNKPLQGSGEVSYILDTTILNPGAYRIDVGLFTLKNRELIAVSRSKNQFTLKGNDITKGGPIKLADTWKYN